uniref:Reverse transcriptase domain-containing protein n=1 Tax=Octopus bimaculoides TaxID=37653 RepID=A0A0L8HQ83_OCTBM
MFILELPARMPNSTACRFRIYGRVNCVMVQSTVQHIKSGVPCAVQMPRRFSQSQHPSSTAGLNTFRLPSVQTEFSKKNEPPALEETTVAIGWLKSRKSIGVDGIPSEISKHRVSVIHAKLHELLVARWEQGKLPSDLRNAVIITLYKNKGECQAAQTTGGSVCFPLQKKFYQVYSSTDLFCPLPKIISQKANVVSEPTGAICITDDMSERAS